MIKVLIIDTVIFHINGMSNVIMGLYENMEVENISFDFVACDNIDEKYAEIIRRNNYNIFLLKQRNKHPLRYIKNLSEIMKKGSYDIIHIHGNSATMAVELRAAKKSRTKAKLLVHAHNTECDHEFLNKVLYSYFIKNSDYHIACSRAAGEWLYGNNKYIVFNNGIDENKFRFNPEMRKEYREKFGVDDKFVVTHIGRFNAQKNHKFILEIFEILHEKRNDAFLRLVGTGSFYEEIKARVEEMGLSDYVCFAGVQKNPEIEYNVADVFLLPSLFESFGLVNIEAQCSGLPCVISDKVPTDIKITENVKFLSLSDSPEKWADTIIEYFGQKDRCSRISEVREHGYSMKENSQVLYSFYKSILK